MSCIKVADFDQKPVDKKKCSEVYTTMLAGEAVLCREWSTPEEDAAWASLETYGRDIAMSVAELITEHVQYTVDRQGHVTAVVVEPVLWQRILEALEDAEDRDLVQALHVRLVAGPVASGALRWDEIANEWQ